jgi:hypothetical protein
MVFQRKPLAGRLLGEAQSSPFATLSSQFCNHKEFGSELNTLTASCGNEPCAQLHFGPQLILRPSGISQIDVKNARIRSDRNRLLKEGFVGNQSHSSEDVFSLLHRGQVLKQGKSGRGSHRASQVDRIGSVFRGFKIQNSGRRDVGAG